MVGAIFSIILEVLRVMTVLKTIKEVAVKVIVAAAVRVLAVVADRVLTAMVVGVMVVVAVVVRVLSFLLNDSHSSLKQLQVAVIRGIG